MVLNSATEKHHFPLPFIDMLERFIKHAYYYFLDGYFGYNQILIVFNECLDHLVLVLQHCKDTNLVLWKNCHFIVQEEIMLGHLISATSIEVDKAKIQVIKKLTPPILMTKIINFLEHARSYNHFTKDFFKIMKTLYSLLERVFIFTFLKSF